MPKKATKRSYTRKPVKATQGSQSSTKTRAKALVGRARVECKGKQSWYDQLSDKGRHYVEAVVEAMLEEPNAHPRTTARLLKEELGLSVNPANIALKIKELMRNG